MRQISFHIRKIEVVNNNNAVIQGRCCGDEIHLNDKTTRLVKNSYTNGTGPELMGKDLMIIFHTLTADGKAIDVVKPGMTAEIVIPDILAEQMHINWSLEGMCGQD